MIMSEWSYSWGAAKLLRCSLFTNTYSANAMRYDYVFAIVLIQLPCDVDRDSAGNT